MQLHFTLLDSPFDVRMYVGQHCKLDYEVQEQFLSLFRTLKRRTLRLSLLSGLEDPLSSALLHMCLSV